MSAIQPIQFNAAKLTARPVKVLDNGAKAVSIDYDGRGIWMVQTPSTTLPYGLNVFDKDGKNPKHSVDISFRGAEDDPKIKSYYEMAEAIDARMMELAMVNSQAWFKLANPSKEVIKAFYTPMVKVPLDKDGNPKPYPPTMKVALKQKDGIFTTEFYDPTKKRYEGVPIEELLVRNTKMRAIIRCTGVWIAGSKFGLSWKAEQVCIDSLPEQLRGFGFTDDNENEGGSHKTGHSSSATSGGNHFRNLLAEDSDDDGGAVAAVMPQERPSKPKAASVPVPAPKQVVDYDEDGEDDDDEVVEAVPVPPKKLAGPIKKPAGPIKKVAAK
jgi:hypothetical protein